MGLRINLPTAGVLAPPLIQTNGVAENTTLEANRVYVANPTSEITLTLPDSEGLQHGDSILVKNITTPNVEVTIASARIEGMNQQILLTDNTPVRFIWTTIQFGGSDFGWLIA